VRAALAAKRCLYSSLAASRSVIASVDSPSRIRSETLPDSEDSPQAVSCAEMISLAVF
jgi:hypothetical protein